MNSNTRFACFTFFLSFFFKSNTFSLSQLRNQQINIFGIETKPNISHSFAFEVESILLYKTILIFFKMEGGVIFPVDQKSNKALFSSPKLTKIN